MDGLMMDYQLNVPAILRRGEEVFPQREIASRLADRSWHTYTYTDFARRAKQLALALRNELGLRDGDRVGTFAWNHHEHLETYVGAPAGGFVTHTLNLRLHPDDLTYIATHAGDRVLIADKVLWPLVENFRERAGFEHVIAIGEGPTPEGAIDYEALLASADPGDFEFRDIDERSAAAMCYTSGTTGQPKGVVYSHRAIAIHALTAVGLLGMSADDVCLPVVPMFHANAWCFPFSSLLAGVKHVYPGPHLDPESLLDAFATQKVTVSAG
ncbi:MAG: AMP-binding protein, partial [Gaiellaceae bacterium]